MITIDQSMPHAIEMYFDTASDSRVRALWEQFTAIGAPSMSGNGSRPHVSLAVSESVDVAATRELLDAFARTTQPFPLSLASFGLFPSAQPVAYLAPKCTAELLALHARFFDQFRPVAHDLWPYYSPAQWNPHCTLTMNLPSHLLAPALDLCCAAGLPITCTVCGLGLVEFPPVKQLYEVPFSGSARVS